MTNDVKELENENKRLETELKNYANTAEGRMATIKSLEQKLKQMTGEKHDLELLLTRYDWNLLYH